LQKTKGKDYKRNIDELNGMLKISDLKLNEKNRLIESYKQTIENINNKYTNLIKENNKAVSQLQSLFQVYNKQKLHVSKLELQNADHEQILQNYTERIKALEITNTTLKQELNKEIEQRRELTINYNVFFHILVKKKSQNELDSLKSKIRELQSKLSTSESDSEKYRAEIKSLHSKLLIKDKQISETELQNNQNVHNLKNDLHLANLKISQQSQQIESLEKTIARVQKEDSRRFTEERSLRKEITKLTVENEELHEKLNYWKNKNTLEISKMITDPKPEEYENIHRVTQIEQKLDALTEIYKNNLNMQNATEIENPPHVPQQSIENQSENIAESEESPQNVIKSLTIQILQKDELKNMNIIKDFKLDQIDLEDKSREYKNFLKAMAALYFANKYRKLIPNLFSHWNGCLHNANSDDFHINEASSKSLT